MGARVRLAGVVAVAVSLLAVGLVGCGDDGDDEMPPSGDTFTDARDGKVYKQVTIGTQTWMAENLNYTTAESWCYGDDPSNCVKYGRLYTWNAALTVCPLGWHLPSDAEWDDLIRHIDSTHISGTHAIAGSKLKSETGWNSGGNGTDEFGFSALPGGGRWSDGDFDNTADYYGNWWSATEYDAMEARYRGMSYNSDDLVWLYWFKTLALSVRCLMD